MDRKAFNFYKSYYDVAKELDDQDKLEFLWAIIHAQFTGEIIEPESKIAKLVFKGQVHSVEKQLEGYKHGLKGPSRGPSKGGSKVPLPQEEEQEQVQGEVEEVVKVLLTPTTMSDNTKRTYSLNDKIYETLARSFAATASKPNKETEQRKHFHNWIKYQDLTKYRNDLPPLDKQVCNIALQGSQDTLNKLLDKGYTMEQIKEAVK